MVDQIFRYSVANNFNLFVPGGPPSPTRQGLVMDTLWYIDQDSGEWINSLATDRPTYNADRLQMTVPLRRGVKWSDGVEFTADDVVFTVNSLMNNPGLLFSAEMKLYVKDISAPDPYTVLFNLNEAEPALPLLLHRSLQRRLHDGQARLGASQRPEDVHQLSRRCRWVRTSPRTPIRTATGSCSSGATTGRTPRPGMITGQPGPQYLLTIFYGPSVSKVIAMSRHELDVLFDLDADAFKPLIDSHADGAVVVQGVPVGLRQRA